MALSSLFDPIDIRDVSVRNRLWIPPMCQFAVFKRDGVPTEWHLLHLGAMARGGAGAVILEATGVSPEGRISIYDLGLWNDEQEEGLAKIAATIRGFGSVPAIQLAHAGRKGSVDWGNSGRRELSLSPSEGGWQTMSASAIAFGEMSVPRPMDTEDIRQVVTDFRAAARRAVRAGFQMVEVHAAHGYLLHQFLSPLSNLRDDEYGGSLANRARLTREVVAAVRDEIGPDLALLVRVSATDWAPGGLDFADTVAVAAMLQEGGVDLIDVSTGGNVPDADIPIGPGYQVEYARAVRSAVTIPVSAVGLIEEAEHADHIVRSGQADVVMVGRAALRNPHVAWGAARTLKIDLDYVHGEYRSAFRR